MIQACRLSWEWWQRDNFDINSMFILGENLRPYLEYCIQLWGPQLTIDMDLLRLGLGEGHKK